MVTYEALLCPVSHTNTHTYTNALIHTNAHTYECTHIRISLYNAPVVSISNVYTHTHALANTRGVDQEGIHLHRSLAVCLLGVHELVNGGVGLSERGGLCVCE
jgi:hypothetical protein